MADQNLDGLLSDSSPDYSQACSPAFMSQPVNEYVITTIRSSSFGGGTGSSMQRNEIINRQRVMNQQHQGRTTQSQSRSQDLAYAAQQGLTEFTNANRAAEPHLRQASSNRPFASSNSGSQHNNQIGIAHDAWDILSNLNPGASNAFTLGNSSNRQANDGSSLFHGHGTVMQQAYNRDSRIQTNIQCPCPVHGQMHCRPSPVGVTVTPMNMHHTALIYRENFLGAVPEVNMNALPTTAISPDMPHQTHFWQDISALIPGEVDTILTDLLPFIHDPNLAADVIDTFAIPTGMQGPFAHEQHFPGVISSDLHTGPANSQMYFVPGQNISRAPPVVVSQNPISLQGPLHGQSSSAVVPRDRRIPSNTQRPPVSGQNLSSAVPRYTNKTLINQGESFSNAVPRDTEKSSIYESKPSAHRQGLFIPLPADTNAFARESVAKSSIATQGQTFSPGQFITLSADTNVFTRGSAAESSIATQGQTSSQGDTNAFARFAGSAAGSSIATQGQTSSQGLFIPSSGRTNALARFAESAAGSSIATQGQTSSHGLFIPSSGRTNAFATYTAQQGLTEFTNANRAAEPHLRQASSNCLFASSNSGSQRNNQIGIAHDAWDILSNLNSGASNAFTRGNSSNRQANDGSSLFHGHGTVMQHAYNRDSRIQTNIQCPCPVHGQMHCRPSTVGVNVTPMSMHHTAHIYRENFLGAAPEVIMNALPTTAISPDMPHQTHFWQDISGFIPGDVDTILTDLLPFIHDPNLAADVIDTFAIPTGMQGPFAHEQHFPGVISSDLHTGPANSQMHFVPDQNISRAPPVVVSQNPNSLQGPLDGKSSSAVVPRDRRIPTNTRRPPVSGQNLSSVVPRDTNKTLINQGESFSNAVPRDTEKSSIYESKPSAHRQGLFIPLPADTNAFARESVARSSIATQGQTFSPGQFIPLSADTNVFARGSTAESSIATQGQTSSQGDTNAFARGSTVNSSVATQGQTSSQGLFIPSSGRTNAFARFAESAAGSSIATQGQTSSLGQSIPLPANTDVFARRSVEKSSIAAQGRTSVAKSTNAFARESVAKSSIATQEQTFSPGQFITLSADTNVFARGSAAESSIATQGQTSSQGDTNAFARFAGSAAGSSIATKGQTSSQGLFISSSGRTNAFARFAGAAAGSSIATQGQTSSQDLFIPSSGRTNAFARFAESAAGSSIATQGQTSSHGLFVPSLGRTNAFARFAESAAGSSFATQWQTSSPGQSIPLPADTDAFAKRSVEKSSIAVQEQTFLSGQSIPLPADTDAFAKRSAEKSSIAAQEQTFLPFQSIPLPADTDAFARRSVEKSSIAAQGQTSVAKSTNAFAWKSVAKSSIATQEQTSSQDLSIPQSGRTQAKASARKSVAKSSIAAQEQTSSQDLSTPQSGLTKAKALARKSGAKSSIAAQEQTSLEPLSKRIKNNSEGGWNLAVEKGIKLGSSMFNQSSATDKDKSSPSLVPTPQEGPIRQVRTQEEFKLVGEKCQLCNIDVAFNPTGSTSSSSHNNTILPIPAVLPCGHCYHYDCLKSVYGSPGKGEVPPCIHCSEVVASSKD